MKHGVFAVENLLSGINSGLYVFPTDAAAAVDLAASLAPRTYSNEDKKKYVTSELRLFRVGTFDIETRELQPCPSTLVPWDFRRLTETPMSLAAGTPEQVAANFAEKTENL